MPNLRPDSSPSEKPRRCSAVDTRDSGRILRLPDTPALEATLGQTISRRGFMTAAAAAAVAARGAASASRGGPRCRPGAGLERPTLKRAAVAVGCLVLAAWQRGAWYAERPAAFAGAPGPACGLQIDPQYRASLESIRTQVRALMAERRVPGMAVAVGVAAPTSTRPCRRKGHS
jgi:hypothetical protein